MDFLSSFKEILGFFNHNGGLSCQVPKIDQRCLGLNIQGINGIEASSRFKYELFTVTLAKELPIVCKCETCKRFLH